VRVDAALLQRASEAEGKARESVALELADLKRQISEKNDQVESARKIELTLRAERRALEERVKAVDVEVGRRVDAERQEIEVCVARRIEEQYRLRIADKEKSLQDAQEPTRNLTGSSSRDRSRPKARSLS
jgi:biotin-(acetyl-CoA carboxylase) ligase